MQYRNLLTILTVAVIAGTVPLFLGWAHYIFIGGLNPFLGYVFSLLLLLIAMPFLIAMIRFFKIRWVSGTGLAPSMLFVTGSISYLIAGGLSHILWGYQTLDFHLHDTYYVISQPTLVVCASFFLVVFSNIYHWFPKLTGRSLNNHLGTIHFWISFVGIYFVILPGHFEKWTLQNPFSEMPRRYIDYSNWTGFNRFDRIDRFVLMLTVAISVAQFIFLFNILHTLVMRKRVVKNAS